MNQVLPIVMIVICIIASVAVNYYMKKAAKPKPVQLSSQQMTANEFINVLDIRDQFLYTRDGQIIAYLNINPISMDLFSDTEKENICRSLTAEFSSLQKPFKFLAVSRPVDIAPLVNEYAKMLSETTDQKQKELLRNEIMTISNYATSGNVIERKFYIMLWSKYVTGIEADLLKECKEFMNKFESVNMSCEVIKEQEIVRLCNLINNPAYACVES